ncbi:MAG TPA: hypothetical protein VGC12_06375 [Methyloradius sp.]
MPLSLKIPALTDKPLMIAETRAQKISDFLENLPLANPLNAATALFEEMEILNRQKVTSDARVKALELYRTAVANLSEILASYYCKAGLPLPPQAKTCAGAAESLWLELSYGYKLALIDEQNKLFSLSSSKSNALIIQRAIEAMSQLALVYYKTYFSPPSSLWSDLNQLYLHAVQQSLHEVEVPISAEATSTISNTFKQTLLASLAYPQHLAPLDIKHVSDYAARYAEHARLQDVGLLESTAGIFLVSLQSDKAPIPYVKNAKDPLSAGDIFLVTVDLARVIHRHIQLLQSDNLPKNNDLPPEASDARYIDLLTHLIKHWGASPKRVFNRSRKSDGVKLGVGIAAAHFYIGGEQHASLPEASEDNIELSDDRLIAPKITPAEFNLGHWLITNISAGGMALRKPVNAQDNIRVGDIVCLKEDKSSAWSIGVIRWATNDDQEYLDIGAQLIAPTAKSIGINRISPAIHEKGLLLPEMQMLKQPQSIIAPSGTYGPARLLDIEEDDKTLRIMITKLIERTSRFERFGFSYIS